MAGAHDAAGTMPASPRTRRVLAWVTVPLVVATGLATALLWPAWPDPAEETGGTYHDAEVIAVREETCPPEQRQAGFRRCGEVTVRVEEGPDRGAEMVVPLPDGPGAPDVRVGDPVVLSVVTDPADPEQRRYGIADHRRDLPLLLLAVLFAVVVVGFGLRRGVAALAGLAGCFVLLVTFVLPAIVAGQSPLLVAVVGAALVMFVIMYLAHGVSVRTSVAVLGTLAALVVTGLLGVLATAATHLTGFTGDTELSLFHQLPGVDLRGVLLAGIIIGSLGVLDDVTVSQAATVAELARADPDRSRRELYRAGIRVGRAHVASVVNTLVLAYAGASLPLLLLIVVSGAGGDLGGVLTSQAIAQEIVRSVVATTGLVAAVPLTTALAAVVAGPPGGRRRPVGDHGPAGLRPASGRQPTAQPERPVTPPGQTRAESPGGEGAGAHRARRVDPGEALAPPAARDTDEPATGW